ncbi:hypothetical protein [Cedratvirus kamchatka]|uniref:Uncharacterized protein n=1 Tax=Cedratvirus kamchatka TaxID=2716914 RepID=A0A6G8MYI4_9VIRU|nr:hypothetical protein [Cedratvirus kamchatka]WIL04042.1 hypothetical protein Clen_112 [Cedratvirus lena]WIL04654.1 hypothetical protein Cduv_174 [Cedratvirus duvanny]
MSYASLFAPSPFLDLPVEVWDKIFSFSHGEDKKKIYQRVFSLKQGKKVDSVLPRQNRTMKQNKVLPREQDLYIEVEKTRACRRKTLCRPKKSSYAPKKRVIKRAKIISHEEDLYQQSLDDPHNYITDGPDDNFCDDYYDDLYKDCMSHYLHVVCWDEWCDGEHCN